MNQVHVYLNDEDHKNLQARLLAEGETVSSWIRRQIKKYIRQKGGLTEPQ